ncbi:MAG: sugar transferase [Mangrovicoccus sp.]
MTIHLKTSADAVNGIVDYTPTHSMYRDFFKRLFDIVFVLAITPLVAPIVLILAALIALDGSSPFYVQRRVGYGGKVFPMVKLRSMVVNADKRLIEHLSNDPVAKQEWDEKQKLSSDPRITTIGRIIRKTSMDELPQFWNVLMGNMSVVGPRPMMPSQRDLYPGQAYYALKPGVTGFWQVGDRNDTSFAERARYDADYYTQLSLMTDLRVIIRTFQVVLRATGV